MSFKRIELSERTLSGSLMEEILGLNNNPLVQKFFEIYKKPATDKGIKNVTVNSKGEMTFLPKGKASIVDHTSTPSVWKKDNRQSGSYGKVLRKLLIDNGVDAKDISARDLELIVNHLKAKYTVEGQFRVVSGSDITKYYLGDNYDNRFNLGSLGGSCMRYSGACQEATRFYAENETCEMVVLMHPTEDCIRGRALLWTCQRGKKWMDRIYANDHIVEAFKQYAKSNGWAHKQSQDPCTGPWVLPNGVAESINVEIDVDTDFYPKPYMDTFMYWTGDTIKDNQSGGYDHYCQSEPEDDEDRIYDEHDDCYIDECDAVYIDNEDYYTHVDNAFRCELSAYWYLKRDRAVLSDGREVYKESENVVYLHSEGEYYHYDDVSYCEFNEEDYPSEYVTYIEDLGIAVHEDYVKEAYESAGWVLNEDDEWVEAQKELF